MAMHCFRLLGIHIYFYAIQ